MHPVDDLTEYPLSSTLCVMSVYLPYHQLASQHIVCKLGCLFALELLAYVLITFLVDEVACVLRILLNHFLVVSRLGLELYGNCLRRRWDYLKRYLRMKAAYLSLFLEVLKIYVSVTFLRTVERLVLILNLVAPVFHLRLLVCTPLAHVRFITQLSHSNTIPAYAASCSRARTVSLLKSPFIDSMMMEAISLDFSFQFIGF